MKNKTCIIISGPTAVGKTALAIHIAQHFSTRIISADSRQCFKELNIGVAKPSDDELQLVKHYFINSHSIDENVNAAVFEKYALQKINEIFKSNDIAVMAGGTGLYIKAFCEGMDEIPEIPTEIREQIVKEYETNGVVWLQKQVQENDPIFFIKGEIKNPQRLMRALEVKLSSGKSILEFQNRQKKERIFNIIKIGLELPKEKLYQNINERVKIMMQKGLYEEAKSLLPYQKLNALQTVGYKELFEHFNGDTTLPQAIEKIKLNTRHYAKRQMTWFKKDKEINWCNVDTKAVLAQLNNLLEI
jgi:tRNA dimethylallyltransferase